MQLQSLHHNRPWQKEQQVWGESLGKRRTLNAVDAARVHSICVRKNALPVAMVLLLQHGNIRGTKNDGKTHHFCSEIKSSFYFMNKK